MSLVVNSLIDELKGRDSNDRLITLCPVCKESTEYDETLRNRRTRVHIRINTPRPKGVCPSYTIVTHAECLPSINWNQIWDAIEEHSKQPYSSVEGIKEFL